VSRLAMGGLNGCSGCLRCTATPREFGLLRPRTLLRSLARKTAYTLVTKGTPRLFHLRYSRVGHLRGRGDTPDSSSIEGSAGAFAARQTEGRLVKSSERRVESFLYEVHQNSKFRTAAECPGVITITYVVNRQTHALARGANGRSTSLGRHGCVG